MILQQVVNHTIHSACPSYPQSEWYDLLCACEGKRALFLYIGGEADCEFQLKQRVDVQDLSQDEMCWATVTPHMQSFGSMASGLYENPGSSSFHISNASVEVNLTFVLDINLIKCKLQEINLYLCYCCLLTVSPAASPRRKTRVLWPSDSVFLMAYCLWTKQLNVLFFSVALLPVFFYTQQVLFY